MAEEPASPKAKATSGLFAGLNVSPSHDPEATPKLSNRAPLAANVPPPPDLSNGNGTPNGIHAETKEPLVENGCSMKKKVEGEEKETSPDEFKESVLEEDSAETETTVENVTADTSVVTEKEAVPPPSMEAENNEKSTEEESAQIETTTTTAANNNKEAEDDDDEALQEAFGDLSSRGRRRRPRGLGRIHPDTPIPHADVALSLLRKFAAKTRPFISVAYGGSKPRGIWGFLFGDGKEDPAFVPYRDMLELLIDDDDDDNDQAVKDEADETVDQITGHTGDNMARARDCMARFVYLFGQWGHASSRLLEAPAKTKQWFANLLSAVIDTTAQLVAHGCWDDVKLGIGGGDDEDDEGNQPEYHPAVYMLTQSIFNADLTIERNELAAMKCLLTTGCRRTEATGQSLLRGSHLLQTIRVLYHIYLTTESLPNKTTARAALQQLVTNVFTQVVLQQKEQGVASPSNKDGFPSESHRDAFLVLRSLCKLSMRNLPDGGGQVHVGLQASGSHEAWDGNQSTSNMDRNSDDEIPRNSSNSETAQLVYTSAMHPALESKVLALELLLYVLQNIDFERQFVGQAGPQFHAAIRNYLCVSLLKNCLSDITRVVNLSLRIFVPLMESFRVILKNEIEAFVTNVFFVVLDSPNTPIEHKALVVNTFDEICSDPSTLAEIFLNYDCDMSAVDLFHRIVNTLSRMARAGVQESKASGISFMGGRDAARLEKLRNENRELRLTAMKALRQVLASLHASIVEPMAEKEKCSTTPTYHSSDDDTSAPQSSPGRNLVENYGSKKKRRAEESEVIIRFNQKPSAGLGHAAECGHVDSKDPVDVAGYLLKNKDAFDKTQIGEYLGREADYQGGFSLQVLHQYVRLMDFAGLQFDDAIRYFLSGFRLPGEAQKIDRIMEKFAERFTDQNPEVFQSADVAFILSFSIIMLNTDLHNPAIKEERRMTREGFVRNNRGISDGQDLPEELLTSIFDRIQKDPISLKEDDEARERVGDVTNGGKSIVGSAALNPASFFKSHYDDVDRARESNFQKERDHIVRTTETLLKRRKHTSQESARTSTKHKKAAGRVARFVRTEDTGLRDEYVSPMFEVTWGPALAAFSTAMESANGTVGSLLAIASDEELEIAAENAAETIEVCLTGFRFAIGTAGLCGNDIARDSYMSALGRFTQLGTGAFLEPRHVRCIQTLLGLAREDGELLGPSWQHVFRALSEINRFHQLFHLMARNDRAAAAAAERRRARIEEKENRRQIQEERRIAAEEADASIGETDSEFEPSENYSLAESELFSDDESLGFEEEMDGKAIDEMNARLVYEAVSEAWIEAIYERSSSLSAPAVKEFVNQLCFVSNAEISVGTGVSSGEMTDLNHVAYRQQHALLSSTQGGDQFHHSQPNIFNLQKLVEVTHYNMDSRPRLIFAELWTIVADHLTVTALHDNPALAMYAVDSFRQLSIQYLKRDELEVFEFQKRFLKPLETVMARSEQASTKELLLDCIDRVIQVFAAESADGSSQKQKGGLRSGWTPILQILGLGACDSAKDVSDLSWRILSREVEKAVERRHSNVLLHEHFVETVDVFLGVVAGPYEDLALEAIQQLVGLAAFLGDPEVALPVVKRRSSSGHAVSSQDHELWWPLLLGLSKSIGDARPAIRAKGLGILFQIIEDHVIPSAPKEEAEQTIQLLYRGILTPVLEFAEIESEDGKTPNLPNDFGRCQVSSKEDDNDSTEGSLNQGWLETVFDQFMDRCVGVCQKSVESLGKDSLTEEVFAMLNSCLLSDSGAMAVRGLRRLEQYVVSDLEPSAITDESWAMICHMLRRCLLVRGLPRSVRVEAGSPNDSDEHRQEFLMEDRLLPDRRYVGPNAVMVIGQLLTTERFCKSMGLSWQVFLVEGLGDGIVEWDQAASLVNNSTVDEDCPGYHEISLYGRTWMNSFLLKFSSLPSVVQASSEDETKTNTFSAAQKLVVDETGKLLAALIDAEQKASETRQPIDNMILERKSKLVSELLAGYNSMDSDHLKDMSWINPVLLSICVQSQNDAIRASIQKLMRRTSTASEAPYPPPELPATDNGSDTEEQDNAGGDEEMGHDQSEEVASTEEE